MWEFIMIAPNGLQSRLKVDDFLVTMSRREPLDCLLMELRKPLAELIERKDEKNPNEEQTDGL